MRLEFGIYRRLKLKTQLYEIWFFISSLLKTYKDGEINSQRKAVLQLSYFYLESLKWLQF